MKKPNKMNKRASFEMINAGMIAFITFVLVALLAILLVSTVQEIDLVCGGTFDSGSCYICPASTAAANYTYNATSKECCNLTGNITAGLVTNCSSGNTVSRSEYDGAAYNATKDLMDAALLPPQFSQIIVIVIIIVGILALLAVLGYGVYNKMRR